MLDNRSIHSKISIFFEYFLFSIFIFMHKDYKKRNRTDYSFLDALPR